VTKDRKPVVPGWFTTDAEEFRLLGTRCTACGTVFFPRQEFFCKNPACSGGEFAEVPLSPRGKVWSYTNAGYRPPAPYVSDPDAEWVPYTLIAVELEAEGIIVLGQAAPGVTVDDLKVGIEVEITAGELYETDDAVMTTWNFKPVTEVAA
jgi:uncharacterized OB-fold protein